jgi:histidyl-tRNA synthetase
MALSTQPYKGARDFYPEEKRIQTYMFSVWRRIAESYGYEEYDAPILEPTEIYLAKTGEEIVNDQAYNFVDRGKRQVMLRPEMTPSVSRLVAGKRQELGYPLRWYSIPNLWRYERPQRGRLREHWQLNVDIFGVENINAELEVLQLVDSIFKSFGADPTMFELRLNHRELVNYILLDYLGLNEATCLKVGKLIDRYHKMEQSQFISKIDDLLLPEEKQAGVTEKLMSIISASSINELPERVRKQTSAIELKKLLDGLKASGIEHARYDPTIMRGFDYYTGIVFEAFDTDPENNRSMLGGGRYDGLVGLYGVSPVPTVGFGWGDVTLENFLRSHGLMPKLASEVDVYIVLAGENSSLVQKLVANLRNTVINVAVDISGRKIIDQIKTADKKKVTHIMVLGDNEISSGSYKLKNLESGVEEAMDFTGLVKALKHLRKTKDF